MDRELIRRHIDLVRELLTEHGTHDQLSHGRKKGRSKPAKVGGRNEVIKNLQRAITKAEKADDWTKRDKLTRQYEELLRKMPLRAQLRLIPAFQRFTHQYGVNEVQQHRRH